MKNKANKDSRIIKTTVKDWGISELLRQNKEALNIISRRK